LFKTLSTDLPNYHTDSESNKIYMTKKTSIL